jgi:hypothetical protein
MKNLRQADIQTRLSVFSPGFMLEGMRTRLATLWVMTALVLAQSPARLEYGAGGVIFTGELGQSLVEWSCTAGNKAEGFFALRSEDIATLEPLLGDAAKTTADVQLETYYRQYAGYLDEGHPIICINLVEKSYVEHEVDYARQYNPERLEQLSAGGKPEDFWMREVIAVLGGGKTFCQAEYDVAATRIRRFGCNGEA